MHGVHMACICDLLKQHGTQSELQVAGPGFTRDVRTPGRKGDSENEQENDGPLMIQMGIKRPKVP